MSGERITIDADQLHEVLVRGIDGYLDLCNGWEDIDTADMADNLIVDVQRAAAGGAA